MLKSKTISVILLLAVFGLGVLWGILLSRGLLTRSRFWRWQRPSEEKILKFIVRRYSRELRLSEEQQNRLTAILKKNRQEIDETAREVRPKFEKIRNMTNQEIKNILTEEQKKKFEKILAERKELFPPKTSGGFRPRRPRPGIAWP